MKNRLFAFALLFLISVSIASSQSKEFNDFWKELKTAISKKDKEKIISMSNFPFIVYNNLFAQTDIIKNPNELEKKINEGYSETTLISLYSVGKLFKKVNKLSKVPDGCNLEAFKLPKGTKVYSASKDYCDLIIAEIKGEIKLVGVIWTPED